MAKTNRPQGRKQTGPEYTLNELKSVVLMRAAEIYPDWEEMPADQRARQLGSEAVKIDEKLKALHQGADDPFLIERALTIVFEHMVLLAARLEINLNDAMPMIWEDDTRSKINVELERPDSKKIGGK